MIELFDSITQYGVLIVISGIFLYNTIADKKAAEKREIDNKLRDNKYNESLQLLSKAIDNIAKLVDLLKQSNENSAEIFMKHDERSIKIDEKLTEIKTIVGNCQKKGR